MRGTRPSEDGLHDLIDSHAQQDVNLDRVFADVSVYSTRVMGVAHVENVAHNACRTALTYPDTPSETATTAEPTPAFSRGSEPITDSVAGAMTRPMPNAIRQ